MEYISQDRSGISNKKLYKCLARQFKHGLFTPRMIELEKARNMTELKIIEDSVTDLNFLRFFPNLEDLSVASANLTDISGLQYAPGIDDLQLTEHALTDISAIRFCPKLIHLIIENCHSKDNFNTSKIWDFSVIGECRNLIALSLANNNIHDISWISELKNLTDACLLHNPIEDFSPLKQLPNLSWMELSSDQVINPDEFPNVTIEYADY